MGTSIHAELRQSPRNYQNPTISLQEDISDGTESEFGSPEVKTMRQSAASPLELLS